MDYTVQKLAKISGVSVRTLHYYDEIDLLKPAYVKPNGYRYYREKELLQLQQILFFRELGFELKNIQRILGKGDFDKRAALHAQKKVLQSEIGRMNELIHTIDRTVGHLGGKKKMKEEEMYRGFSQEKQAEYERQVIEYFGEKAKVHIDASKENVKNWMESKEEFEQICLDLADLMKKKRMSFDAIINGCSSSGLQLKRPIFSMANLLWIASWGRHIKNTICRCPNLLLARLPILRRIYDVCVCAGAPCRLGL